MCVPGCQETIVQRLAMDRRRLFRSGAVVAAAGAATALCGQALPARAAAPVSFSRAVDLTHPLGPDFPTYFGKPQLEIEVLNNYAEHKFNMKKWTIVEHTGTHLDTPFHFSADGAGADQIPVEQLVAPLVVVDIREKAAGDADAQVTPDDLKAWEAANGPIPEGACVAMNSGWAAHVGGAKFRNADDAGTMHFPGFHLEAAQLLMSERNAVGIAVDTLSLDFGKSGDFAVHYAWLPSGRWGIECIAGLDELPAKGATVVLGAPKIVGATGGPSRVIALV